MKLIVTFSWTRASPLIAIGLQKTFPKYVYTIMRDEIRDGKATVTENPLKIETSDEDTIKLLEDEMNNIAKDRKLRFGAERGGFEIYMLKQDDNGVVVEESKIFVKN